MEKHLPARPNLDHLRRQAKKLLAALEARDPQAVTTILKHLPAAHRMSEAEVLATRFRLADAQSAIARESGFASWPSLARHVEQLRSLEGVWSFQRLEVDGAVLPAAGLQMSRLLIDGDRFRTESPEANYEGVFNINVEAQPQEIDIEFVAGPEAGNWNYGIFRLEGDTLDLCLDLNGKPRPAKFGSTPGSGRAYETLRRTSAARPENVTGGTPPAVAAASSLSSTEAFEHVPSPTLTKLQGEWGAVKINRDGQPLPKMMLWTARRSMSRNEVKISVGGQTIIHALVKIDEGAIPTQIDYCSMAAPCQGAIQLGLFKWDGDEACFCMGAPGGPRPADFTAPAGSGRTFSQWRLKK
jgi:uncharacterized protein (TIGR03067 family)